MALAFGKNTTRDTSFANPAITPSITIVQGEAVLVLLLKVRAAVDRTGGAPTFAGQTMTQASTTQKAATSPEAGVELWYLLDPPLGASTASIPNTTGEILYYTLATAKGSNYATGKVFLDGASGSNGTSTNPTPGAVVTTNQNAIGFAITAGGWTSWAPSAQAGTIIANNDDGADGGGEQYIVTTGPGSVTLNWTFGTSDDWGAVAAFFREAIPVVLSNYQFVKVGNGMSATEKIR